MTLNFTVNDNSVSYDGDPQNFKKRPTFLWSKFSLVDINTKYVTPLLYDLEKGDIDPTDSEKAVGKISKLYRLLCFTCCFSCEKQSKRKANVVFMSDSLMMLKQLILTVRLPLVLEGKLLS